MAKFHIPKVTVHSSIFEDVKEGHHYHFYNLNVRLLSNKVKQVLLSCVDKFCRYDKSKVLYIAIATMYWVVSNFLMVVG